MDENRIFQSAQKRVPRQSNVSKVSLKLRRSEMVESTKKRVATTTVISGKKVKVAMPSEVKSATKKIKKQYAQALDNLKNR